MLDEIPSEYILMPHLISVLVILNMRGNVGLLQLNTVNFQEQGCKIFSDRVRLTDVCGDWRRDTRAAVLQASRRANACATGGDAARGVLEGIKRQQWEFS